MIYLIQKLEKVCIFYLSIRITRGILSSFLKVTSLDHIDDSTIGFNCSIVVQPRKQNPKQALKTEQFFFIALAAVAVR